MIKNYFTIALRNLARNKVFSFINIFGLSVGLATCLLIMLYIFDEVSYDKHHKDAERIYRIASASQEGKWSAAPAPLAWSVKNDFPEVEQITRLLKVPNMDKILLSYERNKEEKQFFEPNGYYVDSTFFQIFSYEFKYGNALTALDQPNSLVISETIAAKLFGHEDPINKIVQVGLPFGIFNYTVKGVFRTGNTKSHIPANLFFSMRNTDIGIWVQGNDNWAMNNIFHTYVKLRQGADAGAFELKLKPFLERHGGNDMRKAGLLKSFFLQPLKDIYLRSAIGNEIGPNGNIKYLYILGSIAVFILLIACINFMNLSTAQSEKRAREVGVRKVMGAERSSLIGQFLGESLMMSGIALLLALLLAWQFLPIFNYLTHKHLRSFITREMLLWMAGITLFTGLLSGLYPAFYLSAYTPVAALKGRIAKNFSAALIRKSLVIFQFTISVCLVLGAIVIWRQLDFMENHPLGFEKNQQLVLPLSGNDGPGNFSALKQELLKNPAVKTITSGSSYPGVQNINDMLFYPEGKTNDDKVDIALSVVENDYIETLGIQLLSGRSFSKEFTADSLSIILNEAAVKALGYDAKTAIGKGINFDLNNIHRTMQIVGVVKNFHFESLHNKIHPFGFATTFFANKYNYLIINLQTNNYAGLLKEIQLAWNRINSNMPFDYSFIDQDFQKNYEKEQGESRIVIAFTCIAIMIACLGLFGLAAFSAEQRTREIGIRKTLGASETGIIAMLSKDFIKLIPIALLIAFPLTWWIMNRWLENFEYRIAIRWWMFALSGGIAITIAFVTVSYQTVRAALANPIDSLRTE